MVHTPRQAEFATTKVPQLGGTTSWEQYRQVFDAIVLSNGWDDATAALQLLSHPEGDALNVAMLVPMSHRTSITGLVDALLANYGSPGRLADNRQQFEKTTRSAGEDPSIFAIALETLAVNAFGDMGLGQCTTGNSYPRCCGPMPSLGESRRPRDSTGQ